MKADIQSAQTRMAGILAAKYREARLRAELDNICRELGYDTDIEYQTGEGPADIYLPTRRAFIETKGFGLADPNRPSSSGETQEEQCERYVKAEHNRELNWLDLNQTRSLPWQAILTDGHKWWVWCWNATADGKLAEKFLYAEREFLQGQDEDAIIWLRELTHESTGKPWIPANPYAEFEIYIPQLRKIHDDLKSDQATVTKYDLWLDMLKASGCAPEDDVQARDLFLNHTLLVTIARAVINTLRSPANQKSAEYAMSEGFAAWPQARNQFGATHNEGLRWIESVFATADKFDWRRRAKDVMRNLYEQLIPVAQRKAYGEYYTPDWLAGMLVERIIDEDWIESAVQSYLFGNDLPEGTGVLDPACGSGTFLYHAANRILQSNALLKESVSPQRRADFVAKLVNGVDIHPIAVEISRATLLRALPVEPTAGAEALQIYQGDALLYTQQSMKLSARDDLPFYSVRSPKGSEIQIPKQFTRNANFNENLVRLANAANEGRDRLPAGVSEGLNESDAAILKTSFDALTQICKSEGNGVWSWYISNFIAPSVLAERKIDRIVANPPWVVLSDIQVKARRDEMEQLSTELGLYVRRGKFDIAGIFIKRCRERYFDEESDSNKAAWVLNRAALSATNWQRVRDDQNKYNAEFYDFSKVKDAPFHGARACAWIQDKCRSAKHLVFSSNDKVSRSDDWSGATKRKIVTSQKPPMLPQMPSEYVSGKKSTSGFVSGMKLQPHCLVRISGQGDRLPDDQCQVQFTTIESKHKPWSDEGVRQGIVPARWIRLVLQSDIMLPFVCKSQGGNAVIPWHGYDVDPHIENSEYWNLAETVNMRVRRRGAPGDTTPLTLVGMLNFQNKLVAQIQSAMPDYGSTKVIYNKSGQSLRAARAPSTTLVDDGLYWYRCDDPEEAAYLTSVINAQCLQIAYRQSRKSDRHFDTQFWRSVPIPKYDHRVGAHRNLANLCQEAEVIAKSTLDIQGENHGQIRLSSRIKDALTDSGIAAEIDAQVRKILPNQAALP